MTGQERIERIGEEIDRECRLIEEELGLTPEEIAALDQECRQTLALLGFKDFFVN